MTIFLPFLIALQFLTNIPIHLPTIPTPRQNGLSMLFYPIVGLIIGVVLFVLASWLAVLPVVLTSSLLVFMWVWLTGGLHLDGLADTVDGFFGGHGDTERTLSIMKDPNCGAMGVMAICLALLLKWASVYTLITLKLSPMLIVIPVFGRLVILAMFLTTPYVRKNGLGSHLANFLPKNLAWLVFISGVLLCGGFALMLLKFYKLLILLAVFVIGIAYFRQLFIKKINGITGDTVGASVEMMEILMMIAVCIVSFG